MTAARRRWRVHVAAIWNGSPSMSRWSTTAGLGSRKSSGNS
jgi:hypothetical protein